MEKKGAQLIRWNRMIRERLTLFGQREDGSMVIFAVFVFIMILLVTGMAVDFMRVETTRTRVQATLDRAVLAAADLDQTLPRDEVVADYMAKANLADALVGNATVDEGLNYSEVSASAAVEVPMLFSGLAAVTNPGSSYHESLTVPASATAEERVAKVEISMVLDISGSMNSNNRIGNLRNAASEFVNTVLADSNEDLISVSLIPYSEHVSAGEDLFGQFNVNQQHSYSYCLEFDNGDFSSTSMSRGSRYEQVQHFQWAYDGRNNDRTRTVCPRYSNQTIVPWSQDRNELLNRISQLNGTIQTSIHLGMKWGAGLLDPSTRPQLNGLIGRGDVDSAFAGRPASYDDNETLKFIILMSDGENTSSLRLQNWAYDSDSDRNHWNNYNLQYYLQRYVDSRYHSQFYWWKYDAATMNQLTSNICSAAKDNGIIIWTIGFEVPNEAGNTVLRDCATSPSHFFDVDGVEISSAFSAIATQINNLKLTR